MKVLGISSNYHDASATLVIDGQVACSATEDRFTKQKHDPNFPSSAIDFCLRTAGLLQSEIDYVAYHEEPLEKANRSILNSFVKFPRSFATFVLSSKEAISQSLMTGKKVVDKLTIDPEKIVYIPHHLSHAAQAFLTSPYEESLIVTIDALGEWTSSGLFRGSRAKNKLEIEPLDITPFPHSLGLVYSCFTSFVGFKANDGECSTMALASFGRPTYVDEIKKIVKILPSGEYQVDSSYFNLTANDKIPVSEKFYSIFGASRKLNERFSFSCLHESKEHSKDEQRFADIACSLQVVLEEAIVAYIKFGLNKYSSKNLCYAGGVAQNCVANSKISNQLPFDGIHIPVDPGDGGGSMGAALYLSAIKGKINMHSVGPHLGQMCSTKKMIWYWDALKECPDFSNIRFVKYESEQDLIEFISQKIVEDKVVGWVQGRAENGPRALGNRSILFRPDQIHIAERVSRSIKKRAAFRPYALAVTEFEAAKSLENYSSSRYENRSLHRWMQTVLKAKDENVARLRAGLHIDLTTRVQVCLPHENRRFFDLLRAVGKKTGTEALVNTSLNFSGLPLVNDELDAFMFFYKTGLDILVIENHIFVKGDG